MPGGAVKNIMPFCTTDIARAFAGGVRRGDIHAAPRRLTVSAVICVRGE